MICLCCEDCCWVCEDHPDRPWQDPHACGCGGAGMPCPWCNQVNAGEPPAAAEGVRARLTLVSDDHHRRPPPRAFFFPAFLSTRTPLNFVAALAFFAGFFTAVNSPYFRLRLVHAVVPPSLFFTCDRFFTAPLRALSPTGLLTATLNPPVALHAPMRGESF